MAMIKGRDTIRKIDEDISSLHWFAVKAYLMRHAHPRENPAVEDIRDTLNIALFDSCVVIFQAHYVVLAEIVPKLNFDNCQFAVAAVS